MCLPELIAGGEATSTEISVGLRLADRNRSRHVLTRSGRTRLEPGRSRSVDHFSPGLLDASWVASWASVAFMQDRAGEAVGRSRWSSARRRKAWARSVAARPRRAGCSAISMTLGHRLTIHDDPTTRNLHDKFGRARNGSPSGTVISSSSVVRPSCCHNPFSARPWEQLLLEGIAYTRAPAT